MDSNAAKFAWAGLILTVIATVVGVAGYFQKAKDQELNAWQTAESCGRVECFETYLSEYPEGRYARQARLRLGQLSPQSQPQPQSAPRIVTTPPAPPPPTAPRPVQGLEPEMVSIPGGRFLMGSPESEKDRSSDEKQHWVTVSAFEIGRFEVTQGQWRAVMGTNPSQFQNGDHYPVENVSWHDAQSYAKELSRLTGKNYRLPTEAEWEYACRGGAAEETYCGGYALERLAWYDGNSGDKTHPVGQKSPNGYGLYDMSGNVWELTCSIYDANYGGSEQNCINKDTDVLRVLRGGSWNFQPEDARSANRIRYDAANRYNNLGFRLARTP